MSRKTDFFLFDGANGTAEMLITILNHYANVAYPIGGSECAAASREALQTIANNIHEAEQLSKMAEISRRQCPMLKSAVKWFYTQSEYAAPEDEMYKIIDRRLSKR